LLLGDGLLSQTSGLAYTTSVYFKTTANTNFVWLNAFDQANNYIFFDALTGAQSGAGIGGVTATSTLYANGWCRITVTKTSATTASNNFISFGLADTNSVPAATAGNSAVFAFPMFEQKALATSFIPTTTVAVTRAADVVTLAGAANTASAALPYSMVYTTNQIVNTTGTLLTAGSKTMFQSGGLGTRVGWSSFNSTTINIIVGSGNYITGAVKTAIAGDGAGRSGVANNGTLVTDANVPAIGTFTIGSSQDGYTTRLTAWNSRLSDANLQALTV
jgi:hypothetical protein